MRKRWHLNAWHLRSQKFAGLIFCAALLFVAAFLMKDAAFGNLCLAVTGLYTAFVGGRTWSDGQSLKYGGHVNTTDNETSVVRRMKRTVEVETKEKDREID